MDYKRIDFEVKYELGHSYKERWDKGEHHCPGCGKQTVWEEQGAGDYYEGAKFICFSCGSEWTMQFAKQEGEVKNWQTRQRLENIRKAEDYLKNPSTFVSCKECGGMFDIANLTHCPKCRPNESKRKPVYAY